MMTVLITFYLMYVKSPRSVRGADGQLGRVLFLITYFEDYIPLSTLCQRVNTLTR